MVLADAAVGCLCCVESVELEQEAKGWLEAVGIHEGEALTVLRRAPFGGPIHVRTASGGEFAVAVELAACIRVRVSVQEEPRS